MNPRVRTAEEYRLYRKNLARSIEIDQRNVSELITQIDALQNITLREVRNFSSNMSERLYGLTLTAEQRTAIEQGLLGLLQNYHQQNLELNNVKQLRDQATMLRNKVDNLNTMLMRTYDNAADVDLDHMEGQREALQRTIKQQSQTVEEAQQSCNAVNKRFSESRGELISFLSEAHDIHASKQSGKILTDAEVAAQLAVLPSRHANNLAFQQLMATPLKSVILGCLETKPVPVNQAPAAIVAEPGFIKRNLSILQGAIAIAAIILAISATIALGSLILIYSLPMLATVGIAAAIAVTFAGIFFGASWLLQHLSSSGTPAPTAPAAQPASEVPASTVSIHKGLGSKPEVVVGKKASGELKADAKVDADSAVVKAEVAADTVVELSKDKNEDVNKAVASVKR